MGPSLIGKSAARFGAGQRLWRPFMDQWPVLFSGGKTQGMVKCQVCFASQGMVKCQVCLADFVFFSLSLSLFLGANQKTGGMASAGEARGRCLTDVSMTSTVAVSSSLGSCETLVASKRLAWQRPPLFFLACVWRPQYASYFGKALVLEEHVLLSGAWLMKLAPWLGYFTGRASQPSSAPVSHMAV